MNIQERFDMHASMQFTQDTHNGMCPKGQAEMQTKPYQSLVGSLMYVIACNKPNIGMILTKLTRFLSDP
ncbi:hypothetical protein O6H91_23G037200 [Diphasiastrum complanatum]|uniref:Uncharacterized protein n=1 Tax=Diphasiastrum complanatum TaxID=34168 RepID=A0ACC2A9Q1_DIPCM|nr:hypothetical protein O6H91_23G037200 [Diphasiastrum complanatum]